MRSLKSSFVILPSLSRSHLFLHSGVRGAGLEGLFVPVESGFVVEGGTFGLEGGVCVDPGVPLQVVQT